MSEINQKISIYELHEKIGEGGFGTVFLGYDPKWDKKVAIKILHPNLASNPKIIERFWREGRTTFSLRHPNIIAVTNVGDEDGRYFLVMDYIDGSTLLQVMQKTTTFSLPEIIEVLRPVAEALDYAHENGIIHRDVKPSNILINQKKQIFLSDFGLVKLLNEEDTSTSSFGLVGTYDYMSPEQVTGDNITGAADLYALGVIAYQMLTGKVPFSGKSPYEIQNGHVNQTPPDPKNFVNIPESVSRIILKMLDKDPHQRYANGKEFIQALQAVQENYFQNQSKSYDEKAFQQARLNDFSGAINTLMEAQAVAPTPERKILLANYVEKKELYQEFLIKQAEFNKAQNALEIFIEKVPWIKPPSFSKVNKVQPWMELVEDVGLFVILLGYISIVFSDKAFLFSSAIVFLITSVLILKPGKLLFVSIFTFFLAIIFYFIGRSIIATSLVYPYYLQPSLFYYVDVVFWLGIIIMLIRASRLYLAEKKNN